MRVAIAFAALAACTFSKHVDATDAAPPVPDGGPCAAKSDECANADVLRSCGGAGEMYVDKPCVWGCRTDHCGELVPAANAVTRTQAAANTMALADLVLPAGTIINSNGEIGDATTADAIRPAGPGTASMIGYTSTASSAVFTVKKLRISGDILLIGTKAIAIVVSDSITIEGMIDARGKCTNLGVAVGGEAGPGGFQGGAQKADGAGGAAAGAGTGGGTTNTNGGGGAGRGGTGGKGGGPLMAGGGPSFDGNFTMLVGGGGGGGGGGGNGNTLPGGGGGGALQLISNTKIEIVAGGGINAGGCGGFSTTNNDSGAGGGAGGTIILEAPAVTVDGVLAVNGGGGGAGGSTPAPTNGQGQPGQPTRLPTAGDVGQASGGAGGAGGVSDGTVGLAISRGGGGGGGVGRILIRTRDDRRLMLGGSAVLSPNFADDTTCKRGSANVF